MFISGLAEIAGGIGLLVPRLRRAAGWGLIALLVAVFPANVYMAMHPEDYARIPTFALWISAAVAGGVYRGGVVGRHWVGDEVAAGEWIARSHARFGLTFRMRAGENPDSSVTVDLPHRRRGTIMPLSRTKSLLSIAVVAALSSAAFGVTATDLYTPGNPPGLAAGVAAGYRYASGGALVGDAVDLTEETIHAVLWTTSNTAGVDLHPSTFRVSHAYAIGGNQQVGNGYIQTPDGIANHAMLWSGTAASFVDLNGSFAGSNADGTDGVHQVGFGFGPTTDFSPHATLWSGSASGVVDLHAGTYNETRARAVNGNTQVGYGRPMDRDGGTDALLWTGTAASMVNLTPAGYDAQAQGVSGTQQVGSAYDSTTGIGGAALWTGTAASMVLLNPTGYSFTAAVDTNGAVQVGYGTAPVGELHALAWQGSAGSYVDLHAFLPSNLVSSQALSIIGNDIYGIATEADGTQHAIVWTGALPEPTSLAVLSLTGVMLRRRRA